MNPIVKWQDAFENQVGHGITNSVDIPSHYDFNNERLRYFEDGTRVHPTDSANFTDREADYLIEPNAGQTGRIQSAERPRYVVGVEGAASLAARLGAELGTGDTMRLGVDDKQSPRNAAYFEINGDSANRLVLEDEGSEVETAEWSYPDGLAPTDAIRYEIKYNWYGVGTYQFKINYTDGNAVDGEKTVNKIVGELSRDGVQSNSDGNYHIFQELDATNAGKQLLAGSMGYLTFGDVSPTARTKDARIIGSSSNYGGSAEYEALAAIRVDSDRGNVFAQLTGIEAIPDGGSGEMLAIVVDASETDASGFATPPQHSSQNSVIEQTTSVTEFPDTDGNTVTSAVDPNGYQVGFYATEVTGQGAGTSRTNTESRNVRPLYSDDVCIFLYKDDGNNTRTVNTIYGTRQLW